MLPRRKEKKNVFILISRIIEQISTTWAPMAMLRAMLRNEI